MSKAPPYHPHTILLKPSPEKQSERSTAAEELTKMASNVAETASSAADTTFSALTGATMGRKSSEDYRQRESCRTASHVCSWLATYPQVVLDDLMQVG